MKRLRTTDDEDYRDRLDRALPPGKLWRWVTGAWLWRALFGIGKEYSRTHNRFVDAMAEADPRTADETLDEWEESYGLPDPLDPNPPTTTADRQAALTAKVRASGGQTVAYYIDVAAAMGITITITERPYSLAFRAGTSNAGDSLGHAGNAHYWEVKGPSGTSTANRARLEATFDRIRPAHTVVEFDWS